MSIKSLWPEKEKFNVPNSRIPPVQILEEQAEILPNLTDDMVYAHVARTPKKPCFQFNGKEVKCEFTYGFFLGGKFLDDFLFEVFLIGHNLDIYPAFLNINEEISREIRPTSWEDTNQGDDIKVDNQSDLEKVISDILKSEKVRQVIVTIMSLSAT